MDKPPEQEHEPSAEGWLPPQPPGPSAPVPPAQQQQAPPQRPPQRQQPQQPQPAPQQYPQPDSPQQPYGQGWPQYPPQYPYSQPYGWQQPPPGYQQPPAGWQQPPPGYAQQYPYNQYGWQQQAWAQREPNNDPAIAALTLAICGLGLLILSLGLSAFIVSPAAGAFAIYFGRRGIRKVDQGETHRYRSSAKAGVVLGIVTIVLSLIALAIWIAVIASDPEAFEESKAGAAWASAMLGRLHG